VARILLRCVVSVCSLRAKVGRCKQKKKKKIIATQASKIIFRLPAIPTKQINSRNIPVPIPYSSHIFFHTFCFSVSFYLPIWNEKADEFHFFSIAPQYSISTLRRHVFSPT
jgi:hypothetical protein